MLRFFLDSRHVLQGLRSNEGRTAGKFRRRVFFAGFARVLPTRRKDLRASFFCAAGLRHRRLFTMAKFFEVQFRSENDAPLPNLVKAEKRGMLMNVLKQ